MAIYISAQSGEGGDSFTIPATCTKLVVVVGNHQWGSIGQMDSGAENMTLIDEQIGDYDETAAMWYLDNPTTGARVIEDTGNGNDQMVIAIYLKDTATGAPHTKFKDANGGSDLDLPLTPTLDNCYLIAGLSTEPPPTVYSGQAELGNVQLDSYINLMAGGYQQTTAALYGMGFDLDYGGRSQGVSAAFAPSAAATGTNMSINIGDSWKDVNSAKINISDSWKAVDAIKINVGDTWKDVF